MPEGHTIHRLARDLGRDLAGSRVLATSPQGRFESGAARLDGRVLERTDAAGKHLFLDFGDDDVLYVHLGLIGKFKRTASDVHRPGAVRLRLEGPERAWHLSGPQTCRLVDPMEVDQIVGALGPDPLRRDADPERFVERASRSRKAIGALLLDQDVIAGVGNVYRAEILLLVGVHPARPAKDVHPDTLRQIWELTVELLRIGVRLNRIVTVTGEDAGFVTPGRLRRADALYAYKRDGKPCRRCDTPISIGKVANRSIWWCPTCQPD